MVPPNLPLPDLRCPILHLNTTLAHTLPLGTFDSAGSLPHLSTVGMALYYNLVLNVEVWAFHAPGGVAIMVARRAGVLPRLGGATGNET